MFLELCSYIQWIFPFIEWEQLKFGFGMIKRDFQTQLHWVEFYFKTPFEFYHNYCILLRHNLLGPALYWLRIYFTYSGRSVTVLKSVYDRNSTTTNGLWIQIILNPLSKAFTSQSVAKVTQVLSIAMCGIQTHTLIEVFAYSTPL